MKKLAQEQINKILEGHKHWLNEDCEGWETMKANFSCCDLSYVNLRGVNLSGANLSSANLCSANLRSANLCSANLRDANLCSANLRDANLRDANLRSANLCDAEGVPYIPMVCPEEGDFNGWKKSRW